MGNAMGRDRFGVVSAFSATSGGPGRTVEIANALAGRLIEGDTVLLVGDLAAGKTLFVKAVAAAVGSSDTVTSPTFTIAQFYSSPAAPILHVDAYRLDSVEEYRDLGLDEYVESSITLIEWGDRVAAEFPGHLRVEFRVDPADSGTREIVFSSDGERWATALGGLREEVLGSP